MRRCDELCARALILKIPEALTFDGEFTSAGFVELRP